MPTYDYKCQACGHDWELFQSMKDPHVKSCPKCKKRKAKRLLGLGAGIIFKDALNSIRIGGFKLGFWFAQQGSIYVFVILIFVYVRLMNKLDKKYGYNE
mgnify:CR=1 FL=1